MRTLLARYAVPDDPEWASDPAVKLLSDADRQDLRWQVAEMLLVLARVGADRAMKLPPGPEREAGLNAAPRADRPGDEIYDPGGVPRTAWADRAEVLARSASEEVTRLREGELRTAPTTARDYYLAGSRWWPAVTTARPSGRLEEATAHDPRQFRAWFDLGVAYAGLGATPRRRRASTPASPSNRNTRWVLQPRAVKAAAEALHASRGRLHHGPAAGPEARRRAGQPAWRGWGRTTRPRPPPT